MFKLKELRPCIVTHDSKKLYCDGLTCAIDSSANRLKAEQDCYNNGSYIAHALNYVSGQVYSVYWLNDSYYAFPICVLNG